MNTLTQRDAQTMLNKVPEVTLFFWIIKIMATTVGETAADFLNVNLGFGLGGTSLVMGGLLVAALFAQLRACRYIPSIYWVSVVLISVFGTLVTDNLVDNFGVSLQTTTVIFSLALLATFSAWYLSEKTLSIHSIFTTRRELFYWAAILFTFALGTAAGDLAAEGLQLGYATSAVLFGAAIAVVTIAHYALGLNPVLAFWIDPPLRRLVRRSALATARQRRARARDGRYQRHLPGHHPRPGGLSERHAEPSRRRVLNAIIKNMQGRQSHEHVH